MTIASPFRLCPAVIATALLASCGEQCPLPHCPAEGGVTLGVGAEDGSVLNSGVQATLTGPDAGTGVEMSCSPSYKGMACVTRPDFRTAGTYVLRVTAPGFQSLTVNATVTVVPNPPPDRCTCPGESLQPLRVTLKRSGDAGTATDAGSR